MDANLILITGVIIGYLLDLCLGDPYWVPHPIIAFGKSISWLEKRFNQNNHRKIKGFLTSSLLIIIAFTLFYGLKITFKNLNIWTLNLYNSIFLFLGLANKTLITEVKQVFEILTNKGLNSGRKQIARLVGRDTSQLNEHQIKIAALETLAENLSDGVVAPLFYFAIGGIPAMMTYKMINTLDSMIGYKNKRYKLYGFFAAKLDDVMNYIPARLTAILMVLVTLNRRGLKFIIKYGNKHSSPNAGYPESALAGILNCKFGGSNIYHGELVKKSYIGNQKKNLTDSDLKKGLLINHLVCLVCIILVSLKLYLFG